MEIEDLSTLKKFFRGIKTPIFGVGINAFNRLGTEEFFDDYRILSLYNPKETDLIKKDISIFCLEKKIEKRLRPMNSLTLLSHPETLKYLKNFRNPVILSCKSSKKIENIAQKNNWRIAVSPSCFGKQLFENKAEFRKILKKIGISPIPGRILSSSDFFFSSFSDLKKEFGNYFVVQHPVSYGGKGTFFIKNEAGLKKAKESIKKNPTEKIIVAKFIKGSSPSIAGCVTKFGILSTRPHYQICDIPILHFRPSSGIFCGNDWSASNFSKRILSQAKNIVLKIGNYFKEAGYKGIFGLDFILDEKEERLYIVECNARLTGAFPALTMIEVENKEPPIIAFHLLEYLGVPYKINLEKINDFLWKKKEGAQMFLHNSLEKETVQQGEINAGAYKLIYNKQQAAVGRRQIISKSKIKFVRSGYKFSHLKEKNEFLLTNGIQKRGTKFQDYWRILQILTKKRVLDKSLKDITPEAKKFVELVRKELKLKEKAE